jgi:hypothetical protein
MRLAIRNHGRQRGVAMVEGVVVMPVLVMFFVLNYFLMGTITTKIQVQSTTRRDAMYFANNGCIQSIGNANQGGPASNGGQTLTTGNGGADSTGTQVMGKTGTSMIAANLIGGSQATSTSSYTYQTGGHWGTPWGGTAPNIKSSSTALCNELLWGGDGAFSSIIGFFQLGIDTVFGFFGVRPWP